jgi:hypothetical protein
MMGSRINGSPVCLGTMDFSSLSLHQTKRKEMDAQVKVLELEKALEQAKQQLYKLRKQHYQMAGEDAGWDQNVRYISLVPSRFDRESPMRRKALIDSSCVYQLSTLFF